MNLMKLRLNPSNNDLAVRFGVSDSTVSRILKKWICAMDLRMEQSLIKWPSHKALQRTKPFCFRVQYGLRVVAMIDCFEIFIESHLTWPGMVLGHNTNTITPQSS